MWRGVYQRISIQNHFIKTNFKPISPLLYVYLEIFEYKIFSKDVKSM